MTRKYMLILQALVAIALGVGLSYYLQSPPPKTAPLSLGGDFTLQTASGDVSLRDFKGKVVPIFFGYTHCPDVCPTALYNMSAALQQLNDDERGQIQALFITLDPERDTVEKVSEYASHFHPQILGMTGSREQIDQVAAQYVVLHAKVPMPGSEIEYAIDHSSRVYLIDKKGELAELLHHGNSVEDTVAYLRDTLAR